MLTAASRPRFNLYEMPTPKGNSNLHDQVDLIGVMVRGVQVDVGRPVPVRECPLRVEHGILGIRQLPGQLFAGVPDGPGEEQQRFVAPGHRTDLIVGRMIGELLSAPPVPGRSSENTTTIRLTIEYDEVSLCRGDARRATCARVSRDLLNRARGPVAVNAHVHDAPWRFTRIPRHDTHLIADDCGRD